MDISSSFQCPKCGKISHNPNDVREGYCAFCHGWTGNETDLAIMRRVNIDNVELRAENATLRQDVISLAKGYEDRIYENERLRAALEKIASSGNVHSSWLVGDAREALGLPRNTW